MRGKFSIFAIAFAIVAVFQPAAAQEGGKVPTIGFLHPGSFHKSKRIPLFLKGLHNLGYDEGRNIRIEWRFADGKSERLRDMASDLVNRKVALIVCPGSAASAAIEATRTLPIVVVVASNFVSRGWATSLRRPGGNVTGQSTQALGLVGKQLQLLKEVVPDLSRVAIVGVTGNSAHPAEIREAKKSARKLDLDVVPFFIEAEGDLPVTFDKMKAERVDALMVLRHGLLVHLRQRVATLAEISRLPTLFGHVVEAEAGGLLAYGADTDALYVSVASYIDKILKGADPANLPISQATKFNLTVNLKTANALGLTFPTSILISTDKVIE